MSDDDADRLPADAIEMVDHGGEAEARRPHDGADEGCGDGAEHRDDFEEADEDVGRAAPERIDAGEDAAAAGAVPAAA